MNKNNCDYRTDEQRQQDKQNAEKMQKALENFTQHPERIENFIFYLEKHFSVWMQKYTTTPEGLTSEMLHFSEME